MINFSDTGLREEILKAIHELGFVQPTPIQEKSIPHLLSSNQDLIALAQTGTGKTAAFGLPILESIDLEDKNTQCIILCPTRELCLQISKDIQSYAKYMKGVGIVPVYGGSSIETQIKALNRNGQIVVGTPGRVKDLIKRSKLKLGTVKRVVLDEADEMLTMGFKDDMDFILAETPKEKQTLLFSATMSGEVKSISKKYMNDAIQLSVAKMNEGASNVSHMYYMVQAKDRYEVLKRIADVNPDIYGIVFCRTRRETQDVANKLMQDGYNADAIHGDLSQAQRDEVMGRFRTKQLQILVATDVAARGLDVNDLTHVVNYNLPDEAEIYTHRSGRTGRAGKSGISIAIIHTREMRRIKDIERVSGVSFKKAQVPTGKEICTVQLYALVDKIQKVEVDDSQIEPFLPPIYEKLEQLSREELIKHFVSAEFNRFLMYYKGAKDINISESSRTERESTSSRRKSKQALSRLYINIGNKNNLNPARLIGLINETLDTPNTEIGRIEIMKKFSFFEIESTVESQIIESLKGQEFEGVKLLLEVSQERPQTGDRPSRDRGRSSSRKKRSGGGGFKGKSSKEGGNKKRRRY